MIIKRVFDLCFAFLIGLVLTPVWVLIIVFQKFSYSGPILFLQKRTGKSGREFVIYKFRTMTENAENNKSRLQSLNEADGPVFKIRNDPRYTVFGKFLARTGLDELPQIINILKGEMSWVGPRPLPIAEAAKLTREQKIREQVLPGITSLWVVKGSHEMSFNNWMELDRDYVIHHTTWKDMSIIMNTLILVLKNLNRG